MKALHEMTLNEQSLMPRDWLRRRMTRLVHKGEHGAPFRPSLTLVDISNWFSVDYTYIRDLENGRKVINDDWQMKLSQFFYLLDMGSIELKVNMKSRRKRGRALHLPRLLVKRRGLSLSSPLGLS
jgi:hypothetical protein